MLKSYDELREENQELRYKIEQLKETLAHLHRERRHIRTGAMRDEMIVEFRDKVERYREALEWIAAHTSRGDGDGEVKDIARAALAEEE